jgi:hypothetical protein
MRFVAEQLTELQRVILEVAALDLTVRDSIRQVSSQVGFFVGQQKFLEELEKALTILESGQDSSRVGTEAARGEPGGA